VPHAAHRHPSGLLSKLGRHLHLLWQQPDTFGFNLLQFSNPARLRERLLDTLCAPALQLRLELALAQAPALNVLLGTFSAAALTCGPNTVLQLALCLARAGMPVRLVSAAPSAPAQRQALRAHLQLLGGAGQLPQGLQIASAADVAQPLAIGAGDRFLATHWTTAQQHKPVLALLCTPCFYYLIQEFEPGFYAWSSNHALALETYGMEHIGIFNQALLRDYFVAQGVGRYADARWAQQSLVFEPAVDRSHFHPPLWARGHGRRRLLFYARASNPRNLLGLGLAALRRARAHAAFANEDWEFLAIGGNNSLPPLELGGGHVLQPAAWMDYLAYARLLRDADVLLCPMLSPHTSYPVLEMAASGGLVVTTAFATKTAERLAALSPLILAAPATEEGLALALVKAAGRVQAGVQTPVALDLPSNWQTALQPVVQQMLRHGLQDSAGGPQAP